VKKIVVAIPASHGWFWIQTCLTCLTRYPPVAPGFEVKVVVVDNAWDWSPVVRGITDTRLGRHVEVFNNPKLNKFHATALDTVIENYDFDYLMAMESDVCVLRHGWLPWFLAPLEANTNWFAAGAWHHEDCINPSCTLYRGSVLREMDAWCKVNREIVNRWGDNFEKELVEELLPFPGYRSKEEILSWVAGPFSEKRGWPQGTVLRERPKHQSDGPSHYDPGQALYAWARHNGDWGYLALPTHTAWRKTHWPYQTVYGADTEDREYELKELLGGNAYACHFWLGTGSLNILKHAVSPQHEEFMHYGLPREARFWKQVVDPDVQRDTVALIKKHGWHTASKRTGGKPDQGDWAAAVTVESIYREAGIPL
jgi:hypothetical protein